jgi:DNA relaxase NicK
MQETNMISIDQIRFYIPYVANKFHIEYVDELRLADKIFAFSDYFEIKAESKGQNGYSKSYNFGSSEKKYISVMWNPDRKDMGISIDFTAVGKAVYEALVLDYTGLKVDWQNLIKQVCLEYQGHISRIDIATDLINYNFTVDSIAKRIMNQELVFLNKQGSRIPSVRLKFISNAETVETIYVGARTSDCFLRIYNKKIEQDRPDGRYRSMSKGCPDWVRFEGEFKGKTAHQIGELIAKLNKQDIYSDLLGIVLERWSLVEYKTN